ncbi:unnamed protein product [Spirodela intermedia]|uniref:Uncharacterized protein n=1 Tax=Spirodela intermedia TaxID=51605 RepID=A0A7I8JBF6_SPIIN|nr:unnamed protein product [Spirodela intermedia]CAA6667528.1 unnamed protein product [Spirodela intermedia]
MANNHSPDMEDDGDDDFFKEVYGKEYTGPPRLTKSSSQDRPRESKRPLANEESDGDDQAPDPNAVPTDFTSREAKGVKSLQIFFERVAARDKNVRALFTETVIQRLEKEIGCKIKMDEKFLIVSGKDRLILAKGVDAVHKLIQGEGEDRGRSKSPSNTSQKSKSRSPERSPAPPRPVGRETRSSRSNPRDASYVQRKGFSQERVEDHVREGSQKFSRGSPKAHGKNGVKRRPAQSKSPPRPTLAGDAFNSYDVYHRTPSGVRRTDSWEAEQHGMDMPSGQHDFPLYAQTLEELEAEFNRQTGEVRALHDKEEDEENFRHRERLRELREGYAKKLEAMRGLHARQWEEFLRVDTQRRLRAYQHQQMPGYAAYADAGHPDLGRSSENLRSAGGGGRTMDSWSRYPALSPHEAYGELQHQHQREDIARAAYGGGSRY